MRFLEVNPHIVKAYSGILQRIFHQYFLSRFSIVSSDIMFERLTTHDKIIINYPEQLYLLMKRVLLRKNKTDRNREHFWTIGLENNNRILYIELISMGTVNQTFSEPMDVFGNALKKRAVSVFLVHNHPSGTLYPSKGDETATDRLMQVGNIIKIPVRDHLIITPNNYFSFMENGLMKKLERSISFSPQYKVEERTRKETAKTVELENTIKIAKQLKRLGLDNNIIAQATGIPLTEVEKFRVRKKKVATTKNQNI